MRAALFGGLGGISPILAVLIVGQGEPLAGYIRNFTLGSVDQLFIGYIIKIAVLFGLGAAWAKLNSETVDLKAFQLGIAAPALITSMIATAKIDREESTGDTLGFNLIFSNAYARDGDDYAKSSALDNILKGALSYDVVAGLSPSELTSLFNGQDRRKASERLIALYPSNKKSVVDAVINAIIPEGSASYRVNIYVAHTLAGITGGWQGTDEQRIAIENLRQRSSYKSDLTFRANIEGAVANWRKP